MPLSEHNVLLPRIDSVVRFTFRQYSYIILDSNIKYGDVTMDEKRVLAVKIGEIIRRKRLSLNMTQEKLAEEVGRTTGSIGQIERGETMPSVPLLKQLILVLGIDANDFFLQSPRGDDQLDEFFMLYRLLTDIQRQFLLDFIRLMIRHKEGIAK